MNQGTSIYRRPVLWILLLLLAALLSWGARSRADVGAAGMDMSTLSPSDPDRLTPPVPGEPNLPGQPGTVPIPRLGPYVGVEQEPGVAAPDSEPTNPAINSTTTTNQARTQVQGRYAAPRWGVRGKNDTASGKAFGWGSTTGPNASSTQPGAAGTVPGSPANSFGTTGIPIGSSSHDSTH